MTALSPTDLLHLLPQFHGSLQRSVIVFHDDNHKQPVDLNGFIEQLPYSKSLIVSDDIPGGILENSTSETCNTVQRYSTKKIKRLLGEEHDCVLFDARLGIDMDALGVVSGLIRGGGCLLLLLPKASAWQKKTTAFYTHLRNMLSQQSGVFYLRNAAVQAQQVIFPGNEVMDQSLYLPCKTQDQYLLLQRLFSEITQQARLCHVLVSGRGRGKSSLLGLLAARLLQTVTIKIIIVAPARSTADPFFYHLMQQCEADKVGHSVVYYGESEVLYMAPDALLEELQKGEVNRSDLLLVDEAAAIPQSMLSVLLQHYDRLVFATTTHGYEGSGRGFVLKFFKLLDQSRPEWKKSELHQPVRWQQHDWLEQWIEKLLFLDLQVDQPLPDNFNRNNLQVEQLNPIELVADQQKLESVFSLLVSAHYRTRPSDFAYLLDSVDVRLYALRVDTVVVAVLAINQEGGFSPGLSTQVYRGVRRPKGHLLAQTLCFHGGVETAAQLNYARIMRIAVHPHMQRMGLGHFLLDSVVESESRQGVDIIGCSFSAEAGLLEFWRTAGFSLLRTGFSRDHVSASHAVVMGRALSDDGQSLFDHLQSRLGRNLPVWLDLFLADMQDALKVILRELVVENTNPQLTEDFSAIDLDDVVSFADYHRNYAACWPAISRLVDHCSELVRDLQNDEQKIIYACTQYANDWPAIVKITALSGRGEAEQHLRSSLQHLLARYLQQSNT